MSAVDVLAVMDRLDRMAEKRRLAYSVRDDIAKARDAVAELMELSRSIHGELRALEGKKSIPKMTGPVLKMLARDLDAALARCKGEGA